MRLPLALLSLSLLAACGNPIVPGQFAQDCICETMNLCAPPPTYTLVDRDQIHPPYEARFRDGRVLYTRFGKGVAPHEAVRHAVWYTRGEEATPEELAEGERQCRGNDPHYLVVPKQLPLPGRGLPL